MPGTLGRSSATYRAGASRGGRGRGHLISVDTIPGRYGTVNYPEPQMIPRGAAADALNFISRGTKIEIRPGYEPYGPEIAGSSSVQGIITAHKWDGSEVIFKASGSSLYYDSDGAGTWVEVGTNILAGNLGEHIWVDEYVSPAGTQLWVSSPHTDLIKIMTANPGSYSSQYDSSKNFKGSLRIRKNRMELWDYLATTLSQATKNVLQASYIDSQTYTTVSGESIGTGDGVTSTFSGTLAFKGGGSKRTCFAITATDGVETFVDDHLGNLTGSLGGTGTINYMTGAYVLNFNTAPAGSAPLTATYQWEDSTNGGIADFTKSVPRTAGQGYSLPQPTGGPIRNVMTLNGSDYVLHERNAWVVTISADDLSITQEIYRENMGISSDLGAVATAEGIYYIDTVDKPYVALLTYYPSSLQVLPKDLSSSILDLSGFEFDQCCAFRFENFIGFFCRTSDSSANNRLILLNLEISGSQGVYVYDFLDYFGNCIATKNGALLAGDSVTASVFQLFTNYDDDGALPNSYWSGGIDDYGSPPLKKCKKHWYEGEIDANQSVDVYIQLDRGGWAQIGTISGQGAYVDLSQAVTVGSLIIGYSPIGGGSNGKTSFHYLCEIRLRLGKFQNRQIKFVPTGIGYFSVSKITDQDIVFHQDKLPAKYRAAV